MHFRHRQTDRQTDRRKDTDLVYIHILHLAIKIVYTFKKLHVSVYAVSYTHLTLPTILRV